MKHLKSKLMASAAMLMVATVMISSASFAWFTISTAPEVKGMSQNVACNGNLEMALDNGSLAVPSNSTTYDVGHNEAWGNLVDLTNAFIDADGDSTITLKPVSATQDETTGNITFKAPKFGVDGRIGELTTLNSFAVADAATTKMYYDFGGIHLFSTDATSATAATAANVWAYEVDFWLRSNVAGYATPAAVDTARASTDTNKGLGSWIDNQNITIKLVQFDTTTSDSGKTYSLNANSTTTYILKAGSALSTADAAKIDGTATNPNTHYALTLCNSTGTALSNAGITLVANQPVLVKMYVYWDGDNMSNKDFSNELIENVAMNIQWDHSVDLTDLGVTGTTYTTPGTAPAA